ncbi:hypothetical protein Pse7367_2016 [Thalassoporum mexicanum PCC 7367]|uniref:hypothetical protein n=1 Tax=Thalassoporum mexicanum TaxID=3457544 RepID=UPI00029FA91B|nr:hypothetical protein [Pseudanabaena sp. PCC 7367]AFY70287.1 hypothetical protein Pse7367_2016 [Pseudanabaena sp. PCC 7367]
MDTAILLKDKNHLLDFFLELRSQNKLEPSSILAGFPQILNSQKENRNSSSIKYFYSPETISAFVEILEEIEKILDQEWQSILDSIRKNHEKPYEQIEQNDSPSFPKEWLMVLGLLVSVLWASIKLKENFFSRSTKSLRNILNILEYNTKSQELGNIEACVSVKGIGDTKMKVGELVQFIDEGGELEYIQVSPKGKRRV